ncbi:MAG: glycosyl transferase group 1 [Solirubrobacterales bacterium]|jgi:phosphatidylinositol alpha-1,6-mannosyltransferase|nr:glycosyl transferase group 1 [Solirubrobacterales bacterium]
MFDRMSDGAAGADGTGLRMPRLLIITPDFPPAVGGIQVLVHRLAAGLRGFDTRVLTLEQAGAGSFDAGSGIATRRVSASTRLGAARNVALNALALREGASFRPQLTLSAHIVASPAAATLRRVLGTRTVQYFYAKEIADKPRLAAFAGRNAHAAISISSYTSGLLAELGVARDVRLIPPGVDIPADTTPQAAGRPTFVTVARLADRYKGHDVLVHALASIREQVPDVEWVVVGDGPLRREIEELARDRGVADCVRFVGAVSDEERDSWLRRAHLLAMPSRLPDEGQAGEGFGIVYLEAGAYGKPVVAGNVAGAVDAVSDGETGLLVDPANAEAVAAAITRLLLDEQLARRLGSAGAERARHFSWPVILEQVRGVLLEQLDASVHSRGPARRRSSPRTPA